MPKLECTDTSLFGVCLSDRGCDCYGCTAARKIFTPFAKFIDNEIKSFDQIKMRKEAPAIPSAKEMVLTLVMEHCAAELMACGARPEFLAKVCETAQDLFEDWREENETALSGTKH